MGAIVPKQLTVKEREALGGIISGRKKIDSKSSQEFLRRPHVAVGFEALLDAQGLSDDKLSQRINQIVHRKATVSVNPKTGTETTNIVGIDSNALNAVRTVWQLKGKFTEKLEVSGELSHVDDSQLDKIIDSGVLALSNRNRGVINNNNGNDGIANGN